MNNITKKLSVLLTALMVSFSTSVYSFEGFSVGAIFSSMDFSTAGQETTDGPVGDGVNEVTKTTKTGSADKYAYFGEYTFAQGTSIGIEMIEGTATLGSASRTATSSVANAGTAGTVTADAKISDPITFYVEPTFMINDVFGVYLKGGATTVSVEPKETADTASATASTYKSQDVVGLMTGYGAKYYYGNFFAKLEYVETDFETYSHTSTTGNKNTITADVDTEETRIGIGYNF
ncbi:outer membrane beta-barrel protein [Pelagibacteraceae bacterium]|jgi:opacity protein-like surface antigen|nr:outer membrane beta-barrel protein [Pelagibacteraceae bacterium]MDC0340311.1 outer membrane beta-barrel protein [Pelagibacteraceae bacterium]MDC0366589.1 outer membrane beta-barrel protein [Pelagibacteraceae bacterium]|tara:strand:+ start:115 stop:816 length:702 start_codon:yes stop_codon:yes gene_type:complete